MTTTAAVTTPATTSDTTSQTRPGALARVARTSVRRRRWVVAAWVLLFVVGIAAGGQLFMRLKDSSGSSGTESGKGAAVLDAAMTMGPTAAVLVSGTSVDDPSTRAAVESLEHRLGQVSGVTGTVDAYGTHDPRLRSADGRETLVVVQLRKGMEMMDEQMAVAAMRSAAEGSVPGATVQVGGDAAVMSDGMTAVKSDLYRGELLALPVLLVALFFVFGGLRAALLPLIAALTTSAGTLLVLLGVTYVTDVAPYAIDVVMLLGLGLAVDYSLLIVNRFREARAAGLDVAEAVEHTAATAGRTVTFSALTVATALSGLFAFHDSTFTSVALSGIATVLVALAASVTLVPAVLGAWGRRLKPAPRQVAEDGFFGRLARRVQRRPVLAAVGAVAVLVAAGLPFLHAHYGNGDPRTLPQGSESRQVAEDMLTAFPASQSDPVHVVGRVSADDPRVMAYADSIRQLPGVRAVSVETGLAGDVSAIDVVPAGPAQGDTAQELVRTLREHRPPYESYVTGQAAALVDFEAGIAHDAPYAVGLIALATFVLLFLMTGSVLVPLKALVMNTLSLGATFGTLVWVFQDGHGSGLLGFTAFGAIEAWAPVIVFVFAFGLSMDYEVFLLSRIKEDHDESGDTDSAVANGLQRSGRIITSAASLVMIVFLGFAAGRTLSVKELGLALAVSVAVDATLVRCVLVPATMTLLGRANWWAPAPLRRLHDRFGLSETPSHPAAVAPATPGREVVAQAPAQPREPELVSV